MFLIDFRLPAHRAFMHGFMKGLGAPVLLFHTEMAPDVPLVSPLAAPTRPIDQTLVGDWYRVGADMQAVIARHYGQTTPITAEAPVTQNRHAHTGQPSAKKYRRKRR